ncbi:helix-turn-helix domain-containing protein [Tenacibaculum sp. TC6]|uniref:helix-turn-helix domain-containing protein n=1 Tax=Tenacibaculum sp. TC6 TaxID=3423223 RepID=UPI003D36C2B2
MYSPLHLVTLDIIFLYFYAAETVGIKLKNKFIFFIPTILEFLFQFAITVLALYDSNYLGEVKKSYYVITRGLIASAYIIFICILIMKAARIHNKLLPYFYKDTKCKKLTWLVVFCVLCIGFNIFSHIRYLLFTNSNTLAVIDLATFLILLYYITVVSLVQINIYNLTDVSKLSSLKRKTHTKEEVEHYFNMVEEHMKEAKIFLDSSIDLKTFAKTINLPARTISNAINQVKGTNFNSFVHTYRIDEFKRIATLDKYKNYSIEALATEVGYNSRASFYKNFKKITGTSPSEYIASIS